MERHTLPNIKLEVYDGRYDLKHLSQEHGPLQKTPHNNVLQEELSPNSDSPQFSNSGLTASQAQLVSESDHNIHTYRGRRELAQHTLKEVEKENPNVIRGETREESRETTEIRAKIQRAQLMHTGSRMADAMAQLVERNESQRRQNYIWRQEEANKELMAGIVTERGMRNMFPNLGSFFHPQNEIPNDCWNQSQRGFCRNQIIHDAELLSFRRVVHTTKAKDAEPQRFSQSNMPPGHRALAHADTPLRQNTHFSVKLPVYRKIFCCKCTNTPLLCKGWDPELYPCCMMPGCFHEWCSACKTDRFHMNEDDPKKKTTT
ncbi:hypothetical protein P154DRAFT_571659 [Amniculicola lignicola CBS 123094]|uniref:Uncharacterized protein n=1 Tax=Amniculicola lignicola CBS 123094 TaxID=1392246 RepID=A0A6A5X0H8_9PLEO|nr:hypothetical protein P154DRAFT_571659 [Amniculicola lignicola CBS 123094]